MTDQTTHTDEPVLAEGVDDEPVESNRRLFTGTPYLVIALIAMAYAAFHMVALNGVSIKEYTGIEVPLLPQFPLETWNFRIVHVAGALGLGFLLFSARMFRDDDKKGNTLLTYVAAALAIPALVAGGTAISFASLIGSGTLPEMGGLTTWASFEGTETYTNEVWWFGVPLLVATLGGILLSWFEVRARDQFAVSDVVLAICGFVVAIYLTSIYGTAARNAVGTPFVPRPCLFRRWHPWANDSSVFDLYYPVYHLRCVPAGVESRRLLRQLRLRSSRPGARWPS